MASGAVAVVPDIVVDAGAGAGAEAGVLTVPTAAVEGTAAAAAVTIGTEAARNAWPVDGAVMRPWCGPPLAAIRVESLDAVEVDDANCDSSEPTSAETADSSASVFRTSSRKLLSDAILPVTGLGLARCGRCGAAKQTGAGACLCVQSPRAGATAAPTPYDDTPSNALHSNHVLVSPAYPNKRHYLRLTLFSVYTAASFVCFFFFTIFEAMLEIIIVFFTAYSRLMVFSEHLNV